MYKFDLEPVLNHRKYVEESIQKELAGIKRLLYDEKKRLNAFKKNMVNLSNELRTRKKQTISSTEILVYHYYFKSLLEDIEKQKIRVHDVRNKLIKKRKDLIEAMKKRKTLEKLDEHQFEKYKKNLEQKEQEFLNEIGMNRYNRKKYTSIMT